MTVTRALFALPIAFVLAFLALAVIQGSPEDTQPAHAGPCARDPHLLFENDDPGEDGLEFVDLFATAGKNYREVFVVDTDPNVPPEGKPQPYATISITADDGHAGINITFSPESAGTQFESTMTIAVDPSVPPGQYTYDIRITCHTDSDTIPFTVWVGSCPAPQGNPSPSPTPEPFPEECTEETPTPGPSPTVSPCGAFCGTPTPTPPSSPTQSPTPTLGPEPTPEPINSLWGDSDCDGDVTTRDNQALLRTVLQQPPLSQTTPCFGIGLAIRWLLGSLALPAGEGNEALWGDSDCDGEITTRDNQALLREVLQQNALSQTEPCPDLGETVSVSQADG